MINVSTARYGTPPFTGLRASGGSHTSLAGMHFSKYVL